jgi:hypothetical protein
MTEPYAPRHPDHCYGIFEDGRLRFNFYATDDEAAFREARVMGWELENIRALRDGKWSDVKS